LLQGEKEGRKKEKRRGCAYSSKKKRGRVRSRGLIFEGEDRSRERIWKTESGLVVERGKGL